MASNSDESDEIVYKPKNSSSKPSILKTSTRKNDYSDDDDDDRKTNLDKRYNSPISSSRSVSSKPPTGRLQALPSISSSNTRDSDNYKKLGSLDKNSSKISSTAIKKNTIKSYGDDENEPPRYSNTYDNKNKYNNKLTFKKDDSDDDDDDVKKKDDSDDDDDNRYGTSKYGKNKKDASDDDSDDKKKNNSYGKYSKSKKDDSEEDSDDKKINTSYTKYGNEKSRITLTKNSDEDSDDKKKPNVNKYGKLSTLSKINSKKDNSDDEFEDKKKTFGKKTIEDRFSKKDSDEDLYKNKFSSSKPKTTISQDLSDDDWRNKFSSSKGKVVTKDDSDDDLKSKYSTNKTKPVLKNDYDDDWKNKFNPNKSKTPVKNDFDDDWKNKFGSSKTKIALKNDSDEDLYKSIHKKSTDFSRDSDEDLSKSKLNGKKSLTGSTKYDFDDKPLRSSRDLKNDPLNTPTYKSTTSSSYRNPSSPVNKNVYEGSSSFREKDKILSNNNKYDLLNNDISRSASPYKSGLSNSHSAYNSSFNNKSSIQKYNSSNNLNYDSDRSSRNNLSIKEAKNRSFLVGSLSSSGGKGLLGSQELDKHVIDRKLRVLVVTWNLGGLKNIPEKLEELVLPDNIETMPDLFVIGGQEFDINQKDWEIKLQEIIGPTHVKLSSYFHGSISVTLFIKRDLIWFCSVIDYEAINLRAANAHVKTKASIVVSFQFFGTLMCFICSHFTSGDESASDRVQNYINTVNSITLPRSIEVKNRKTSVAKDEEKFVDNTTNFDCIFWFGDFNSRSKKDRDKIIKKVEDLNSRSSSNYEEILNHDELHQNMHNNTAFNNFVEPRIRFPPTYKYDLESDNYDTSEKCRIPSYCDRILYRNKHKNSITCTLYDTVKQIKSSDHRPVLALLEVLIRPGVDKVPLTFGSFDREIYIAGYKKRQMYRALDIGFSSTSLNEKEGKKKSEKSSKCPIM